MEGLNRFNYQSAVRGEIHIRPNIVITRDSFFVNSQMLFKTKARGKT